ncbi:hypothetical protein SROCM77S_00097 [Streptomyces rochei]
MGTSVLLRVGVKVPVTQAFGRAGDECGDSPDTFNV